MKKKGRILYIDNEKENLDGFQLTFWQQFDILKAGSISEAEKLLSDNKINLVLIENDLPEDTGIHFIGRIKNKFKKLPFILLTTCLNKEILRHTKLLGIKKVCEKPWKAEEVSKMINDEINNSNMQERD